MLPSRVTGVLHVTRQSHPRQAREKASAARREEEAVSDRKKLHARQEQARASEAREREASGVREQQQQARALSLQFSMHV